MTEYAGAHDGCGVPTRHTHCSCGLLAAYEVNGRMERSYIFNGHETHE